jgi:anaerobic selenocysteine-containing dehydrogenase
METHSIICQFCQANCRLQAHVDKGMLVKLSGCRDDIVSLGYVCQRAASGPAWLYHPEQLRYALKRAGRRGEGRWERVPWEGALDEIAGMLLRLRREHGPETLAFLEGGLRSDVRWARTRFANHFGNPQNVVDAGGAGPPFVKAVDRLLVGGDLTAAGGGVTDCAVFWGMDLDDAWAFVADKMRPLLDARRSGARLVPALMEIPVKFLARRPPLAYALFRTLGMVPRAGSQRGPARFKIVPPSPKIIVVDSLRTAIVDDADVWLKIRPGTDAVMARGWLHVMVAEQLYDADFVQRWCTGFDALAASVRDCTPNRVAEVTGTSPEDIVAAARMYAGSRPATLWRGTAAGPEAVPTEQALLALVTVTGNLDVFGGNELRDFPEAGDRGRAFVSDAELEDADVLAGERRGKQVGSGSCPLLGFPGWEARNAGFRRISGRNLEQSHCLRADAESVFRALSGRGAYPVRALISWCNNPAGGPEECLADASALMSEALELHVALDSCMSPAAAFADFVLPVTSFMERPFVSEAVQGVSGIVAGQSAVAPLGQRRHDYDFWRSLGCRVGQEAQWPWKTLQELHDHRLVRLGLTHSQLVADKGGLKPYWRRFRKYRDRGFPTPSGKVELGGEALENLGWPGLPTTSCER